MTARVQHVVSRASHPLSGIRPRPLSIRTLDRRAPSENDIRDRIRGEFSEMRGLSPTLERAARLVGATPEQCRGVLSSLVQEGALTRDEDGRYRLT
jgi:hypothetical protein